METVYGVVNRTRGSPLSTIFAEILQRLYDTSCCVKNGYRVHAIRVRALSICGTESLIAKLVVGKFERNGAS